VAGPEVTVFAVEESSVQVAWSALPCREMTLEVGGRSYDVVATPPDWYRRRFRRRVPPTEGGPGALTVAGLEPETNYEVLASGSGYPRRVVARGRTLAPVPGRRLFRFATVSDCHIGEKRVSLFYPLRDPSPRPPDLEPYPVRSARAALQEAEGWGAELVVAKGDLTSDAKEEDATTAAELLSSVRVPVEALLGNHDVDGPADVAAILKQAGVAAGVEARAIDFPGFRLVIGHSPVPGLHGGRLGDRHVTDLVELAGAVSGPVVVALHHPPRRHRWNTYYPPAISWADSRALMAGLARANPRVLVVAGHTHRNRLYRLNGVPVAEVGATKDYPGQWAGYDIHEGGIRQIVRRTEAPSVIAWTESTRWAVGGVWGWWSPGTLADRCFTIEWPAA